MRIQSRRRILATTILATGFVVVSSEDRSHAQVKLLLPELLEFINGIASALYIIDIERKYLLVPPVSPSQPLPICKLTAQELDVLHIQCRELARTLENLDGEPVAENGNRGVVATLSAYLREPDTRRWRRALDDLVQLLLDAQAFLASIAHITGPNENWASTHVPVSNGEIQKVTVALNLMERTLAQLDINARGGKRLSRDDAQKLLDQLSDLPRNTADTLDAIASLQEARGKATCP